MRARAPWSDVLLVCRKCARKQKGGIDGKPVAKWLKKTLKHEGRRDLRIVETGCFDLCPKHGVTLALGSELAAGGKPLRVFREDDPPRVLREWLGGARD